ncbi:MAG: type II secretion system F family protein, partial [Deltaproteobacteria bacterium]|nr:type II secretion system F family protein [Deltaproteobacteria bacterium]
MNFLLPILIFAGIMLILCSLYIFITVRGEKRRIVARIDKAVTPAPLSMVVNAAGGRSGGAFQQFCIALATRLGRYSTPNNEVIKTHRKQKLIMAGYRKANAPVIYYGTKIFFTLLFPAAFLLARMFIALPLQITTLLMLVLSLALAGFYSPDAWVQFAIARRQEKITNGFPDALDLMVVCVEAGIGLDQAIKTVSDEMRLTNETISDEFAQMNLELRAGRSRQDAMRNLGTRTGVEDV